MLRHRAIKWAETGFSFIEDSDAYMLRKELVAS